MKPGAYLILILGIFFLGMTSANADPTTYTWGGGTGYWSTNGSWTPSGAPPAGDVTRALGGGVPGGTIVFNNNATSVYTSTYDFTSPGPVATWFNLDQLDLNGGATTATGNNTINVTPSIYHNLSFAGGGGGIVNSTSHGVGYTVDMAVVVGPPVSGGYATLNLSGNGTSVVALKQGVLPDPAVIPFYQVHMVKTGTSTFELDGTIANSLTSIREGAIQYGNAGTASVGLIELGDSSGTAAAKIILHNGDGLANTGDITVVHSAGGGTRTIQSTANGIGQTAGVGGDVTINHSGGLIIDSGSNGAVFNLSGAISGSGDLIVTGTGRVFTTSSMAGYTGNIVVQSGTYTNASLFGTGTAPVTLGNGTGDAGMNFSNSIPAATYAQPIIIGAGAGAREFSATENGTLTGSLTFNNGADFSVASGKAFIIDGALTGSTGGLEKLGSGTLTLGGSSTPSSPGYTAPTLISAGTLVVNRDISGSDVTISAGAILGGSGSVGAISGAGLVAPGNSPGITTAPSVDPSGGLDFLFQFTGLNPVYGNPTASVNDILRLTSATPFSGYSLNGTNSVTVDFSGTTTFVGQTYLGGFYTDSGNFFSSIQNGAFNYIGLGSGQTVSVSMIQDTANFGAGNVNGYVTRFDIVSVPEPSRCMLLAIGFATALLRRKK